MIYFAVLVAAFAAANAIEEVEVAIFSFNHGQSENPPRGVTDGQNSKGWIAGMKKDLIEKTNTLLDANPNVKYFCFADQEAMGVDRKSFGTADDEERGKAITVEWFCHKDNKKWVYVEDKKIGGVTKANHVWTSAGCCRKSGTPEIDSKNIAKDSHHYAFSSKMGLYRTKGYVWVKFPLPNGITLQFIGTHSDTKDPMKAISRMKSRLSLNEDMVQIITGDLNIRMRDPKRPDEPWKCSNNPCTPESVEKQWRALTQNAETRNKAIGFHAIQEKLSDSDLTFSKVPETKDGSVLATYKYKVDDENSYDQQPSTMTFVSKLFKKNKPQIGLLDFSFARHMPSAPVKVDALAGSYHYLKGTDHLLHFQVFKIASTKNTPPQVKVEL